MIADDETEVLSLGAMQGGVFPTPTAWGDAVMRLSRRVRAARNMTDSPLSVNVVFGIPGEVLSFGPPEIKAGRYSRPRRLLLVNITLPDTPVPEGIEQVLINLLELAIGEAEFFGYRRRLITRPLAELRSLVASLR